MYNFDMNKAKKRWVKENKFHTSEIYAGYVVNELVDALENEFKSDGLSFSRQHIFTTAGTTTVKAMAANIRGLMNRVVNHDVCDNDDFTPWIVVMVSSDAEYGTVRIDVALDCAYHENVVYESMYDNYIIESIVREYDVKLSTSPSNGELMDMATDMISTLSDDWATSDHDVFNVMRVFKAIKDICVDVLLGDETTD